MLARDGPRRLMWEGATGLTRASSFDLLARIPPGASSNAATKPGCGIPPHPGPSDPQPRTSLTTRTTAACGVRGLEVSLAMI